MQRTVCKVGFEMPETGLESGKPCLKVMRSSTGILNASVGNVGHDLGLLQE